jgi:hypothetical protein
MNVGVRALLEQLRSAETIVAETREALSVNDSLIKKE